MDGFNIAEAKAQFSDLVERAAAGEEIEIKKRGKPVAKIVPIERKRQPIDVDAMRALTDRMKRSDVSGVDIVREMRDSRY